MPTPSVSQAFDAGHAETYDRQIERILPFKAGLHLLLRSAFGRLPPSARVLVVGAGTGAEARHLAPLFPEWRFTLVDPSAAMLAVARREILAAGFADRCDFHVGFVSSLASDGFDAATSVLVSHFIADADERQTYFAEIARRLKPGGLFFDADLCADVGDPGFGTVMELWLGAAAVPDERRGSFQAAFGETLAAHGPAEVEAMMTRAGFSTPVPCFQAALIRGWVAERAIGEEVPSRRLSDR